MFVESRLVVRMAYLHYRIRIPILIMATLYYAEVFAFNRVLLRFQS